METLLVKRDSEAAVNYVKAVISDLLCDRIDVSKLIITKELSKEKYAAKQPHAELAKKLAVRDPGSAPKLGDRVSFIICAGSKNELASMRAEDPMYVVEKNLPIDTEYYLKNQIMKPIERLFDAVLGGVDKVKQKIFQGAHMRNKVKSNSVPKNGPMFKYVKILDGCIKCNQVLTEKSPSKVLCQYCFDDRVQIHDDEQTKLAKLNEKKNDIWSECYKCQGSKNLADQCSNRDCGIFYARKKIINETEAQKVRLERFCNLDW